MKQIISRFDDYIRKQYNRISVIRGNYAYYAAITRITQLLRVLRNYYAYYAITRVILHKNLRNAKNSLRKVFSTLRKTRVASGRVIDASRLRNACEYS